MNRPLIDWRMSFGVFLVCMVFVSLCLAIYAPIGLGFIGAVALFVVSLSLLFGFLNS